MMSLRKCILELLGICSTLLILNPVAFCQAVSTVQISGIVQDSSGSVIPDANITASQLETGLTRNAVSGPEGNYAIPQLPVGHYQLTVEKSGFKTYLQKGIEVQVGDRPLINVTMELGTVQQQVEVSAGAQMVQTTQTSVSTVIDQKRIVQLPLNGRQATQLIILAGGATQSRNGGAVGSKNYPSSVALSVAGASGNSTNYLMDGADNEDAFTNVNQPFPFPDALQEFSVQTSVTSASHGLRPGATVNVVTKSGTNQFHGDLFEFVRNGNFNARNFFAATQDTLRRNQFGGTIGGPIIKDKLFFFAGYQGTRNRQNPPSSLAFIPTPAMLAGDFRTVESAACQSRGARSLIDPTTGFPFPTNNVIPVTRFSAPSINLVTKYLPATTDPCGATRFGIPTTGDEDQEIGRVDWVKSEKQTIFTRYFITDYRNPAVFDGRNLLATARPGVVDRAQNAVIGHTYTFSPHVVNSFHARFSRTRIDRGAPANMINPKDLGVNLNPLVPNFLDVTVSGSGFVTGCGTCAPGFFNDTSYQVADDVDYIHGKHQFAFGGEYFRNGLNWLANTLSNGQFVFNGQFTGDSLADFMLGRISSVGRGGPLATSLRQNIMSYYAQDTWQAAPNLTVTLGLRWEPLLPEADKNGIGVRFDQAAYTAGRRSQVYQNAPPGFFFYGDPGIPKSFTSRDWNNLAPRVGLSWHPKSNTNTVVRASYGVFYQQPIMMYIERFSQVPPFGNLVTLLDPAGGFANPLQSLGGDPFPLPNPPRKDASFIGAGTYINMPSTMPTSYTHQWNLVVQRQLGPNWLISASYIGNKSTHLWYQTEANPAVYTGPNSTVANTNQRRLLYLQNPSPTVGALVGSIAQADPGGNANYNGIILSANHRFSQNFSVLGNWTFSHCLSEADGANDLAFPQYMVANDRHRDYGNCIYDHRHIFNTSFLYTTPSRGNAFVRRIIGGWEMSTIFSAYSGDYLNPSAGQDNSRTGVGNDRPNVSGPSLLSERSINRFFNTSVFTQAPLGTFGNAGRNTILGPSFVNFDLGMAKRINFTEARGLEIRGEFFNVLNHTNFNDPSTNLTSATFGRLTTAMDPRIIQVSMKLHF